MGDKTRLEKGLIALRHLFNNSRVDVKTLRDKTDCSEQSASAILKLLQNEFPDIINLEIINRRHVYSLKKKPPIASPLTERAILWMTLAAHFSDRLLSPEIKNMVDQGLGAVLRELWPTKNLPENHPIPPIKALGRASIDYGQAADKLETIIKAINLRKLCEVVYAKDLQVPKTVTLVAPLELASYHETIYVWGYLVELRPKSLKIIRKTTLSVQRLESVKLLPERDTTSLPRNVSFRDDKIFGIIQDNPFDLNVNFSSDVARYVSERTWCQKQELVWLTYGRLKLRMRCGNPNETINWLLSFGSKAIIIAPIELKRQYQATLTAMAANYNLLLVKNSENALETPNEATLDNPSDEASNG
jgi:hypothetical protein